MENAAWPGCRCQNTRNAVLAAPIVLEDGIELLFKQAKRSYATTRGQPCRFFEVWVNGC